jgi:hypothetical protein
MFIGNGNKNYSELRQERHVKGHVAKTEDSLPGCHGKWAARLFSQATTGQRPVCHDRQGACLPFRQHALNMPPLTGLRILADGTFYKLLAPMPPKAE